MARRLLSAAERLTLQEAGRGGGPGDEEDACPADTITLRTAPGLLLFRQKEQISLKDGASVCLRGTHGIIREIRADTSHSGFIAGEEEEEEEMNYSTSLHLLLYG